MIVSNLFAEYSWHICLSTFVSRFYFFSSFFLIFFYFYFFRRINVLLH
ncbi:hypothetical protein, partial [Plasmodium yoelii yoelii]